LRCAPGDFGVRAWAEALILTVFSSCGTGYSIIGGGSLFTSGTPIRELRSSDDLYLRTIFWKLA
ncbi:MAG: hypothetical protein ABJF07_26590, partial [Nisaea sp.]|uniref:hypothetical protein n=1 Tax=Nisaea sp. TaxID=2024842 RepID=UPI0032662128